MPQRRVREVTPPLVVAADIVCQACLTGANPNKDVLGNAALHQHLPIMQTFGEPARRPHGRPSLVGEISHTHAPIEQRKVWAQCIAVKGESCPRAL